VPQALAVIFVYFIIGLILALYITKRREM
jgi:hypothetical protein